MVYQRASGVTFELAADRAVVLDDAGTTLITLNPVGTLIWRELDGVRDIDQLAADLIDSFTGVTLDQLRADVEAFLHELERQSLIEAAQGT